MERGGRGEVEGRQRGGGVEVAGSGIWQTHKRRIHGT